MRPAEGLVLAAALLLSATASQVISEGVSRAPTARIAASAD